MFNSKIIKTKTRKKTINLDLKIIYFKIKQKGMCKSQMNSHRFLLNWKWTTKEFFIKKKVKSKKRTLQV